MTDTFTVYTSVHNEYSEREGQKGKEREKGEKEGGGWEGLEDDREGSRWREREGERERGGEKERVGEREREREKEGEEHKRGVDHNTPMTTTQHIHHIQMYKHITL